VPASSARKSASPFSTVISPPANATINGSTSAPVAPHRHRRRSAVFAPLDNLGIIVVDEEHEHSYKQEESPHYHARDVAVMRGHLERVAVVLGSATPSLESWHHAKEGKYRLVEMLQRVEEVQMPSRMSSIFAPPKKRAAVLVAPRLIEAIQARIDRHEQSIIFLNRRGYASSLQCPQCDMSRCVRTAVSHSPFIAVRAPSLSPLRFRQRRSPRLSAMRFRSL